MPLGDRAEAGKNQGDRGQQLVGVNWNQHDVALSKQILDKVNTRWQDMLFRSKEYLLSARMRGQPIS